jgi:methionine-rich copper-binding protein CopC
MKPLTAIAALATVFAASGAWAHAHVVKSEPAANATVAAPKTIHIDFSEGLEAKFSGASLAKATGGDVAASAKAAGKAIDLTPKAPLAAGGYKVTWHALSTDGHKSEGSFSFTVK